MAAAYPYKKYNYSVEIDGISVAGFSEVSGFDASVDVIEYREGSEAINSPRKMPGLTKFGNVTMKWGMSEDMSFIEWIFGISKGTVTNEDRNKDVTITLMGDDQSTTLAVWTLMSAWPCKYTAPDFNASSSEVAFESIELAFEEMERTQ